MSLSKRASTKFSFKNEDVVYLSKFGGTQFSSVTADLRVKFVRKSNAEDKFVEIGVYDEEFFYDIMYNGQTCDEKRNKALKISKMNLDSTGAFSETESMVLMASYEPKIWYFAALDCQNFLKDAKKYIPRLEAEIIFLNDDGSQFSYEDKG